MVADKKNDLLVTLT